MFPLSAYFILRSRRGSYGNGERKRRHICYGRQSNPVRYGIVSKTARNRLISFKLRIQHSFFSKSKSTRVHPQSASQPVGNVSMTPICMELPRNPVLRDSEISQPRSHFTFRFQIGMPSAEVGFCSVHKHAVECLEHWWRYRVLHLKVGQQVDES